jgi:hypothetical protein
MMKLLFTSVMRPNLEVGKVVWSPRLEKDKNLVESVQRRATSITPGLKGKSYEERLKIMKLPSLLYRRLRGDFIEVYKYIHGLFKVPEGLLEFETRTITRGHSYKLKNYGATYPRDNISSRFESPTCGTASLKILLTLRV